MCVLWETDFNDAGLNRRESKAVIVKGCNMKYFSFQLGRNSFECHEHSLKVNVPSLKSKIETCVILNFYNCLSSKSVIFKTINDSDLHYKNFFIGNFITNNLF